MHGRALQTGLVWPPRQARPTWRQTLLAAVLLAWLAAWPLAGGAHALPESRVWVDSRPDGLRLTLLMPLNRLEFAFGQPLVDAPAEVLPRHAQALAAYVQRHVGARSGRQPWKTLAPRALRVIGDDGQADLEVVLDLRAPPGADPRHATLRYDAVTHEVKTHRVQVLLRADWDGGFVAQPPRPLGQLDSTHTQLELALDTPGPVAAAAALMRDGLLHIAQGSDHLLFLLLLLVVAPLSAQDRRWRAPAPAARTLRRMAWLVSAFTLGHTLTLVLGSLGQMASPASMALPLPPARAVEMAVAATIVLAAVHAWRPLWPGSEAGVALVFGLVHGFAFSASLSGAGLAPVQHALALLCFNLGIEAAQLLLLAACLPPLLWLTRHRPQAGQGLRLGVAGTGLAMGLLWLAARSGLDRFAVLAGLPLLQ
jgi:hypothetical protein